MELTDLLEYVKTMTGGLRGKVQAALTPRTLEEGQAQINALREQDPDKSADRDAQYDSMRNYESYIHERAAAIKADKIQQKEWGDAASAKRIGDFKALLARPLHEQVPLQMFQPNPTSRSLRRVINGDPVRTGHEPIDTSVMAVRG